MSRCCFLVAAWLVLETGAVRAKPLPAPAPPPAATDGFAPTALPAVTSGYRQHDGYWMRLQLGVGYLSVSSQPQEGQGSSYSGTGITFGAAFGGVVRRNFVLYGELLVTHAVAHLPSQEDPRYEVPFDLTMIGIGPGIAYFFDPHDVYLSTSVTVTGVVEGGDGPLIPNPSDATLALGIGVNFMVGKEWWISSDWGLGLAAQARFAATARGHFEAIVSGSAYSLLVSSTFN